MLAAVEKSMTFLDILQAFDIFANLQITLTLMKILLILKEMNLPVRKMVLSCNSMFSLLHNKVRRIGGFKRHCGISTLF